MSEVIYFGCVGGPGHFFFKPGLQRGRDIESAQPWGWQVDGWLCPGTTVDRFGHPHTPIHQLEGDAALHHKDGWTALAFWDRSCDARPGCNSVFLIKGEFDFDGAVREARQAFPEVWRRFKFPVQLAPVGQIVPQN
jgi:hypothetical protein